MAKRKRILSKVIRFGLLLIISLGILLTVIFFTIGPSFVAKRLNPVSNFGLEIPTDSARSLHQSLTIADLHADSLLWGRDLAKLGRYGHVDISRLLQGNVALEIFSVVTKVPAPLLLEGNSDRTDDITKLAILQRWPISTWFSLKNRSLHQAKQLQTLEKKTADRFRIIKTKKDLSNYLLEREQNHNLTAGLLSLEGAQALEGKIENVDRLYEAGFRLIGLAHFFDNETSGSVHGVKKGGLSPFGREVVRRMEKLNIIVDLAHASARTIDDVLSISSRPVIISHTGVKGICNNTRNNSDN